MEMACMHDTRDQLLLASSRLVLEDVFGSLEGFLSITLCLFRIRVVYKYFLCARYVLCHSVHLLHTFTRS